jgi:molybdopterin converting factor small subunit
MVEIRYKDQFEVSELAGQTVSEAREQFKAEFGIPNKAKAKLNGSKVKSGAELDTVLNDDDKLTFAVTRSKGVYLVGALLLALAITGGIFAAGFINATTTLTATTVASNFADVSVNPQFSQITWNAFGFFKGSIPGPHGVFNISPAVGYTGDLVTTVTLGNADQLVKRYRVLALQLEMVNASDNSSIDVSAGNGQTWVMLTLDNGAVSMFTPATGNMTVRVKKGFYITQVFPAAGWTGSASPELFCEVAQR